MADFNKTNPLHKVPEAKKLTTIMEKWLDDAYKAQGIVEEIMEKDPSLEKNNFLTEVYRLCDEIIDTYAELKE